MKIMGIRIILMAGESFKGWARKRLKGHETRQAMAEAMARAINGQVRPPSRLRRQQGLQFKRKSPCPVSALRRSGSLVFQDTGT